MSSLISRIGARGLLSSSSRILAANPNLHTSAPAAEVVTVDGKRASVRGNWMNAHNYKKGDREIHNSIHIMSSLNNFMPKYYVQLLSRMSLFGNILPCY